MDKIKLNNLDGGHMDMLSEIGNIGAGNANTALSRLLNKRIDMDVPLVKITDFDEIAHEVFIIPKTDNSLTPILSVIPAQLFAYYCAVQRGNDPDKPRNLAKSVTVE